MSRYFANEAKEDLLSDNQPAQITPPVIPVLKSGTVEARNSVFRR